MAGEAFHPAWWCRNPHLQTAWSSVARRRPVLALTRERLELPDGDFVDLDWAGAGDGPIVIVLHGLQGSSDSNYVRGLAQALVRRGWRAVVMHFRGCSGEPNRLARSYHSGDTGDLGYVVATLRARAPTTALAAVGYSLGGNVLVKWLGETGAAAPLRAAVAVCVPYVLSEAALRLERGVSRIYQWRLLRCLRAALAEKQTRMRLPIVLADPAALRSFRAYDEHVTAPLHGFRGADDYYAAASSRPYLKCIAVPTLLLHARDDPFLTDAVIPHADELAAPVTLELYAHGGHVGFVAGRWPWRPVYWLEKRIPEYLSAYLLSSHRNQ